MKSVFEYPGDKSKAEHIGDGVYAEYDQFGVWLRTERENGWHSIYLEDEAFTALVKGVAKHYASKQEGPESNG